MIASRAERLWTGSDWLLDGAVVVQDGVVVEVREGRRGDRTVSGWIGPGFVNAHCHLELSWAAGRVPGGEGLGAWVGRLMGLERPPSSEIDASIREAAAGMAAAGTVAVCDIHNGPSTGRAMAAAGLVGVAQHELLGMDPAQLPENLRLAEVEVVEEDGVWRRPSPHAGYSTPPELLVAASRPGPVPASIHLAEDEAERAFIAEGAGPLADFLDRIGRDWSWWKAEGRSPVAHLDALGVLGPDLLLVPGVLLTEADRRLMAARGATLCLCPRSNLHIGGVLPDVPALLDAGVRLALGTDSAASCPDLHVYNEVSALVDAFPDVPPEVWLRAVTSGGADALRLPGGRLGAGARAVQVSPENPLPRRL